MNTDYRMMAKGLKFQSMKEIISFLDMSDTSQAYHMKSLKLESYDQYTKYMDEQDRKFQLLPDYSMKIQVLNVTNVADKCDIEGANTTVEIYSNDTVSNEENMELEESISQLEKHDTAKFKGYTKKRMTSLIVG